MNRRNIRSFRSWALTGVAMAAIAGPAYAEDARRFEIPQQSLIAALEAFGKQGDKEILFSRSAAEGRATSGVVGEYEPAQALSMLLDGSGLRYRQVNANTYVVEVAQDPQGASAGGSEVEALIVTAQKREEDIQDVPIAMSAFTQESLERSQIAGGPDLMTQVPNMTFTKTNFSSYSIQIRGIGTQAVSATTDPAVAVAYLNTPFIRNRFFEQEFYDMQRVEVLRGPQGTLYGRNATAGVVNLLPARPKYDFEAKLSADVGNYGSTRLEGMINLPLVEDIVALRLAGAWTKRDGYVTNQMTGQQIDGRDLWSGRATLGFEPTNGISAYLTYEHFEEDDDRLRTGKQLCKKAPLPTEIGGVPTPLGSNNTTGGAFGWRSYVTQGCVAASLYSDESFQTPNSHALPYYGALFNIGLPVDPTVDPYLSATQSRDLRVIESSVEPRYQASADILHLQLNFDLTDALSLTSETAFSTDSVFSTQDYNRFTTSPGAFTTTGPQGTSARNRNVLDANGVFCDPQLGCSDRLLAADLSTADSQQYSQELRLGSDFDGPFNFNLGVNFLRHDAVDKYYVFVNTLTLWSALRFGSQNLPAAFWTPGVSDNSDCVLNPFGGDAEQFYNVATCIYIDPNPIGALNDLGHNYFLSKNPYRLISYAAFGEVYYNVTPDLKLTAGLRYTVDKKRAPEVPSWLIMSGSFGYPVSGIIDQEWREPTGRVAIDWKPDFSFTDETLLYASYAHGYKAGGANPPRPVIGSYGSSFGLSEEIRQSFTTFQKTFDPEFIDAFEVGTKNTLFDGRVTLNAGAFYYDYKDYQISEIANRQAINRNFDAEVWGAELELDWRPLESLRFSLKQGWERTRVADGEQVIDLMDRTAGDPDYYVIKPFPALPSNCIVPTDYLASLFSPIDNPNAYLNPNLSGVCTLYYGSNGGVEGTPLEDVPNNGEGIFKDLGGNELPNAPEFTTTLTVDYTVPLPNDWLLTLHADYYRQSEAWWRIINADPYDRLEAYQTVNFAAFFTNEDAGWKVMAYVKNVFDKDAITGAFLNSDDSGLTTNVFLTEPRLYGIRVTKEWNGAPWWSGISSHEGPYPFTVELGGGVQKLEASNEVYHPGFVDTLASDELPFPLTSQEEDLDWGDQRSVKATWRPANGPWTVSGGVRFGRTNGAAGMEYSDAVPGGWKYEDQRPDFFGGVSYVPGGDEFTRSQVQDRERHTIVDFAVGREIGIGVLGTRSTVGVGLRYAQFESDTTTRLYAQDWTISEYNLQTTSPQRLNMLRAEVVSERAFEGTGPSISWSGVQKLFGDDDSGVMDLDWSLTGSVLFGKQRSNVEGGYTDDLYSDPILTTYNTRQSSFVSHTETLLAATPRSEEVTVPAVGVSLGLSYSVGRVGVSTGYSWERFFDVIDGGLEESKQYDRTIQGPFLKLKIGFGG